MIDIDDAASLYLSLTRNINEVRHVIASRTQRHSRAGALVLACVALFAVSLPSALIAADTGPPPPTAPIKDAQIHGRWHLVEVVFALVETNGVGSKASETLARSRERQAKVKEDIRQGKIAIVTRLNSDGSYSHEVLTGNTGNLVPVYSERGDWRFDSERSLLSRQANNQEITTLEECVVTRLTDSEMELRVTFTDGENKGIVEINHLRKHSETGALEEDN